MERVSVLCLLLLLRSLSGAEHRSSDDDNDKASPVSVNVARQPQPCPPDVHAVLRDVSVQLAVLQTKMEHVQTINQEQAAKLREVDIMKLQLLEQSTKLKELEMQTSEVATLKLQQQEQAAKLRELQTNEVDPIKEQLRVRQIAFSASLLTSGSGYTGPFNAHTPLVFRNVISNIGNAYNPNTGYFIAPVKGAYHFEFYIAGLGNSENSGAALVKNGEHVVVAYETEAKNWGQSANAATLLLEVNDVVSLRLWINARIYENENRHNTFSGRLLFTV